MDIRQTLRYLGAPIGAKRFLFGDNRSVVTSATLPHSTLTTICAVQTPNLVTLWTSISRVLLILSNQSQRK